MSSAAATTRTYGFRPGMAAVGLALALAAGVLLSGCRAWREAQADTTQQSDELAAALAEEHVAQAEAALNEGDIDAALAAFAEAIQENPRIFRAHMGMGDIYRERGEYGYAEQSYREAAEINPGSYEANYFHGLALQILNRLSEAVRAYRRALAIDPRSHEANLNLATAYLQSGQPTEALPFALTAAELQPAHGPTRVNLGAIYAALSRHEEAVQEYEEALELMAPSEELVLNLTESLRRLDRHAEMATALEAIVRESPTPGVMERLGYARFKLQEFEESKAAYRQSLAAAPEYYPSLNGLAVNLLNDYLRSGRTDEPAREEAVSLLRQSLRIQGEQPRIVELLARYGR